MDISTIGASLKRKLGPLPVWAWAILGGAVVYFLRKRGYFGGTGDASASALEPSQVSATTPQQPVVLQPGESAYDPNSGSITTAPGGGTGSDGGAGAAATPTGDGSTGADMSQAFEDLAAAIQSGQTDQGPAQNSTKPRTTLLARAKGVVKKGGKLGPKEKARLEKEGYTNAQINYHTKRHTALGAVKPRSSTKKAAHTPSKGTTIKTTKKPVTRSAAHVRTTTGGRTAAKTKQQPHATKAPKTRASAATTHSTVRQRPKVSLTRRTAPVAHPAASNRSSKATVHAAPRPSAPPPRTVRTPPKPAPKPAPKKKKR